MKWCRRYSLIVSAACVAGFATPMTGASQEPPQAVADVLRNRLEAFRASGFLVAAGRPLLAREALPAFYQERLYEPVWTEARRGPALTAGLRRALAEAPDHGLDSRDYRVAVLDSLSALTAPTVVDRADLEMLLTDAFLVYGSHLLHGQVNPETVEAEWTANRRRTDMAAVLAQAVASGDVAAGLRALAPSQPRYAHLVSALAEYREIQARGGWETVPGGPKLEVGSTGPRVGALRARLLATGDLPDGAGGAADEEAPAFDELLGLGVSRFQERHGLDADGIVGPMTLAALNVPVQERIRQIEVNLERWRWLPAELGRRHIEVNIAAFQTDVVEDGRVALTMRAIVGREYRETPMFSARMTHLVLSPYWHVPPGIAVKDKLPAIKRDPGYVAQQNMVLFDAATNAVVDPMSVEWSQISGSDFNRRFRLRQNPGPANALGGVKFMFPNRHSVYLHDTPSRELFSRSERAFSSGCIRVQRPLDLADYLLQEDPRWNRESIKGAMERGTEQAVILADPVPVHLLYWTAWSDAQGTIHFRRDLYGRDGVVSRALDARPVD